MFLAAHVELTRNHDLSYTETVFDDLSRELEPVIHDHARDTDCRLVENSVDRAVCVPISTGSATLYYKDASCTEGVVGLASSDAPFLLDQGDICGDANRLFEPGAPFTGPVYAITATGCASATPTTPTYEIVEPGADAYPRFTRTLRPGAGPIREARWASADGFDIAADNLWNDVRDAWCTPLIEGDSNALICGPRYATLTSVIFSDAACAMSAGIAVPACVETGSSEYFPTASDFFTCDGERFLPALYDVPITSPSYLRTEHGCTPVPASMVVNSRDFSVGVNAADYPSMVRE